MRRSEAEIPLVAVLEAQQLGAVLLPASGFLPEFGRLHGGHQHFDGAGAIHFLTYDHLDLAQNLQAQRHPVIKPRSQLLDQAGAQHQLVAGDFRVVGSLFESGDVIL